MADLAAGQNGVVSRSQLLELGIGGGAIDHRVAKGRLHVTHRGVYAVGHSALSAGGRLRAAVLAAGPGALLSHRTAAHLWRLIPSGPPFVEVTVAGRRRRSRPGLRVHVTRWPVEVATRSGFPVTTPRRTLEDLATVATRAELDRARSEARYLRLVPADLDDDVAPTRSELERRLLGAVKDAALPRPAVNHRLGPFVVDFAWLAEKVVVETDGWRGHGHRLAFERDRARDAALLAQGYLVLRFSWRQVVEERLLVAVRIAQVLSRRMPDPPV